MRRDVGKPDRKANLEDLRLVAFAPGFHGT